MTVKEKIQAVITKERQRLEKEIKSWNQKLHETEVYYGANGPYYRQLAAKEKRERQLDELKDLEEQLVKTVTHKELTPYILYCKHCGAVSMTFSQPHMDYADCPCCRHSIYTLGIERTRLSVVDDGSGIINAIIGRRS